MSCFSSVRRHLFCISDLLGRIRGLREYVSPSSAELKGSALGLLTARGKCDGMFRFELREVAS